MSPIRTTLVRIGLTALLAFMLAGCGDNNSENTFSPNGGGAHVSGWMPGGHKAAATANINSCSECHGSDSSGGISRVACSQCHMGGRDSVHPIEWGEQTIVYHRVYVIQNGTAACANSYCHGQGLTGVTESGPSCAACHPWQNL